MCRLTARPTNCASIGRARRRCDRLTRRRCDRLNIVRKTTPRCDVRRGDTGNRITGRQQPGFMSGHDTANHGTAGSGGREVIGSYRAGSARAGGSHLMCRRMYRRRRGVSLFGTALDSLQLCFVRLGLSKSFRTYGNGLSAGCAEGPKNSTSYKFVM